MAHVLVVDDDEVTRQALHEALTDEGHEVAEAADGQAALDFLHDTPLRWAVLLDYFMPDMDGRAVLEAVAADRSLSRQHAYILVSASPQLDAPAEALRAALDAPLLPKPFDLDDMYSAVAQAEVQLEG
jgi:CheY-like chemotaxis protein